MKVATRKSRGEKKTSTKPLSPFSFLLSPKKGFTLIELLTVIAIIALLASIILASLTTARQRSRDAKRVADIKSIELALSLYFNDCSAYPANIYAAGSGCSGGLAPTYLPTLPTDPSQSGSCSTGSEASCYKYAGLTSGSGTGCVAFHLGATLEQSSNTALSSDADAVPSGQPVITGGYPTADTAICSGSGADFTGADPVYDVHS